jgi:DNA-binding PadR family transcriptional regulator
MEGGMLRRDWGGFDRGRERVIEKGDLKYVILELLSEKPRHGYEVIRALTERSRGLYAPSPGAVYPTLQMLQEMDYATVSEQDGKRVYTITAVGQAFLAERGSVVEGIRARLAEWWRPEVRDEIKELMRELAELGRLFPQPWRGAGPRPEQLRRIRESIAAARREVEAILAEAPEQSTNGKTQSLAGGVGTAEA